MKINVEVDCTPAEARAFLGLPDVQPMQKAMMDQLQDKMSSSINAFSPEGLMQSWFNPNVSMQVMDMFQSMISRSLSATTSASKEPSRSKESGTTEQSGTSEGPSAPTETSTVKD